VQYKNIFQNHICGVYDTLQSLFSRKCRANINRHIELSVKAQTLPSRYDVK